MKFPQVYWAYFVAEIAVVGILCLLSKGDTRKKLGWVLLASLTALVVTFVGVAMVGNRMMKSNASVATDQAELQLRLYSCVSAVERSTMSELAQMLHEKAPASKTNQPRKEAYASAERALRQAVKQTPTSRTYKAKLAILLGTDNQEKYRQQIAQLADDLGKQSTGNNADDKAFHSLSAVLKEVFVDRSVAPDRISADRTAIETALPAGWYRDNALSALYEAAHAKPLLVAHQKVVDQKYVSTFGKMAFMFSLMIVCGLVGVIVILVQLALVGRAKQAPPADAVGLPVSALSIYAVFVSWFSIQIILSLGFHALSGKFPAMGTKAELVALSTAITYLVSNLPGPFLIYFLALKPKELPFWSSLRIQLRTATSGPPGLIAAGWLAWCSAIPLIIGAAAIASKFLGTQGSDNPVIGQIVQAAGASSTQATFIFYFTLGVMAPFFEEILFRGFIYAALKRRIGTALSVIASALLFATMHFDRGGILMLFAIGLVLAYTFERTRSLVPSMIAHGLWNSGSFTLALVLFGT